MSYLIIGVDPGHTIGLAALDLSGRPVRTAHIQQEGFGAALAELESWGTPSLIASDVRPAPELVLKLASAFNAALFVPERPWREDDKRAVAAQMLDQFGLIVQNVHERDALAAAVQAWRRHQNLLRQQIGSGLTEDETSTLRHLLLQGVRQTAALEMIKQLRLPPQEEKKEKAAAPASTAPIRRKIESASSSASIESERVISELRKRIAWLEAERETQLHRIRLLENGVTGARMADRERQMMATKIQTLQYQLDTIYGRRKKNREIRENRGGGAIRADPSRPQSAHYPRRPIPPPRSGSAEPSLALKPNMSSAIVSTHSTSSFRSEPDIPPADAEADLKKLNAIRLAKMIEEYRRTRAAHDASR